MTDEPTPASESARLCPTCERPIPEGAPDSVCPACAFLAAAESEDTGSQVASYSGPRFEAPSLDEVRLAFPQLEIHELIGCGGMGAVFRARQPKLQREVALKILPSVLAENPDFIERFTREGQVLAKLSHPNIVNVYDFGTSAGGEFSFLLMELVDGVNLRQAMRAGRFSPMEALGIVPRICEALQYAHDQGVLHRDIKPENLLIDAEGNVKIVDFGIAKLVDAGGISRESILTRTGVGMPGTPQYMAPEQIEKPAGVDHRADIYSLGVVFYELLTGELPLGRFAAPSAKSDVDERIDAIVMRTLEKEKELRQQSAEELRTDVLGARMRRTPSVGSTETSFSRRSRRIGILWIVSLLFLVGGLVEFQKIQHSNAHLRALKQSEASIRRQVSELERAGAAQSQQLVTSRDQLAKTRDVRNSVEKIAESGRNWQWLFAILGIGFFPVMTGIAWRQLWLHRMRAVRKGHRWVLFPATLPVVVVVGGGALALWIWMFQPAPDGVERFALVVGVLLIVGAAVWWIRRMKRWVKTGTSQIVSNAHHRSFDPERIGWAILLILVGLWMAVGASKHPSPVIERVRATAYVESPEKQIQIESRFVEIAPPLEGGESPGVAVVEESSGREYPVVRLPQLANAGAPPVLFPEGQTQSNREVFDMPVETLWYLAFREMRDGRVLEESGQASEALDRYRDAAQYFDAIATRDPEHGSQLEEEREKLQVRLDSVLRMMGDESSETATSVKPTWMDPSDLWFRAFLLLKEGEEHEARGESLEALNKFVEGRRLLMGLAESHPEFHTEIVKYRLLASADRIAALRDGLRDPREIAADETDRLQGRLKQMAEEEQKLVGALADLEHQLQEMRSIGPAILAEDPIEDSPKTLAEDPVKDHLSTLDQKEIEPGDLWARVQRLVDEAETYEADDETLKALSTYTAAVSDLEVLTYEFPGFEDPDLGPIQKKAQARILELRSKTQDTAAPEVESKGVELFELDRERQQETQQKMKGFEFQKFPGSEPPLLIPTGERPRQRIFKPEVKPEP